MSPLRYIIFNSISYKIPDNIQRPNEKKKVPRKSSILYSLFRAVLLSSDTRKELAWTSLLCREQNKRKCDGRWSYIYWKNIKLRYLEYAINIWDILGDSELSYATDHKSWNPHNYVRNHHSIIMVIGGFVSGIGDFYVSIILFHILRFLVSLNDNSRLVCQILIKFNKHVKHLKDIFCSSVEALCLSSTVQSTIALCFSGIIRIIWMNIIEKW